MHACMYAHARTHAHMHARTHTHTHAHTRTYTHAHTRAHTHTHTHTHTLQTSPEVPVQYSAMSQSLEADRHTVLDVTY